MNTQTLRTLITDSVIIICLSGRIKTCLSCVICGKIIYAADRNNAYLGYSIKIHSSLLRAIGKPAERNIPEPVHVMWCPTRCSGANRKIFQVCGVICMKLI